MSETALKPVRSGQNRYLTSRTGYSLSWWFDSICSILRELEDDIFRELKGFPEITPCFLGEDRRPLVSGRRIRIFTTADEYVAQAEVPELTNEDEIQVELANHVITISAETQDKTHGYNYSFAVPSWLDEDSISAKFENGAIRVSAPLPANRKPREIPVTVVPKESEDA